MKVQRRFNKYEYTIYAILITMVFLAPTFSALFHGHDLTDTEFLANDLLKSWKIFIVYVIAFAIHDQIIAPLLIYKHKPWYYVAGIIVLAGVFMLYQCNQRPDVPKSPNDGKAVVEMPDGVDIAPPGPPPPEVKQDELNSSPVVPPAFQRRDIVSFILFLFGLGTNLGVKLYIRSLSAKQRLEELEKENSKQQLENLKYQIHPHFFMNTLNNIHALVDIDPEKAQESIIDLSKLMRYILYESNHEYVQASREVEFMANYVRLMSLRYNDKLKFTADNSDDGRGIWIPPLIFISFVENAFKHGVSYNKESFIKVGAKRYISDSGEQRLDYTCRNSKQPKKNGNGKKVSEASGVGLTNIKSRLDLMFGDNYTLDITDGEDEFIVKMDIPVYTKDPNTQSEEKADKKDNK